MVLFYDTHWRIYGGTWYSPPQSKKNLTQKFIFELFLSFFLYAPCGAGRFEQASIILHFDTLEQKSLISTFNRNSDIGITEEEF